MADAPQQDQEVQVLADEKDILLDHEYDGIRELDNSLPPWWLYLFYTTILFGVVYFVGYQVTSWFDSPQDAYTKEVALFSSQGEVEIKLLTDSASLASGEKTFKTVCFICHGVKGEGKIGPNLTDDYWIHGQGSLKDIVGVATKGVEGKMPSQANLGQRKLVEVASYIVLKIKGTHLKGPLGHQGKLVQKKVPPKETPKKKGSK